jgi:hypothetical protein
VARKLNLFHSNPANSDPRPLVDAIQEAVAEREGHSVDLGTLLSPGGELWHGAKNHDAGPDIRDFLNNLAGQEENHSSPPDWVDNLPSPATLQALVTENLLDLIHDVKEALPDQTQDWPSWLQNPSNLQAVKAIGVDHVQDLIHDVREILPDELQNWSGWSELGNGLPSLSSIGDHLGDIRHVLQQIDPSHLQQWSGAAHATFETIHDAAEHQFGDLGSLGDILGQGRAEAIFQDLLELRPDSALIPDL